LKIYSDFPNFLNFSNDQTISLRSGNIAYARSRFARMVASTPT